MKYFFMAIELCIFATGVYMLAQDNGDKYYFATSGCFIAFGLSELIDSIKEEFLVTLVNREKL